VPRTVDAGAAAVAACREAGAPVLSRGGGTSLAGQCVNPAVVIDWTKYCHRVVSFDKQAKTAIVEPGAALDKVNDELAPHGLMVGPKPSTHVSCTIGGMIGNNSCGSTAQAYGKMADSVRRLEVLTYGGLRTWTGETSDEEFAAILAAGGERAEVYGRLREIRDAYLGEIRTGYPKIPRNRHNRTSYAGRTFHVARPGRRRAAVTVRNEIELFGCPAPLAGRALVPRHRRGRRRRPFGYPA
jgi:FAD/FMN-containing dehydrogenase